MPLITKKNILLTGAGFSANFGGLLSREMWSKILSNPKMDQLPQIREILRKDFDFESVYSNVKKNVSISKDDKNLFQKIVFESYSSMDDALKNYRIGGFPKSGFYIGNVTKLLGEFSGLGGEVGAHFTLNQDLLVERETQIIPLGLSTPQNSTYRNDINSKQIDFTKQVVLPDDQSLEEFKSKYLPSNGSYCYIKLHGSLGWLSHYGHQQLILGTNKIEDIKKEPLLNWYFDIFKDALSQNGVKLFVLGYSFRDEHVNEIIIDAIEKNHIQIYIISPEDPEGFKDRMEGKILYGSYEIKNTIKIWNAVDGYFPYRLSEIFPSNQMDTAVAQDIKKAMNK